MPDNTNSEANQIIARGGGRTGERVRGVRRGVRNGTQSGANKDGAAAAVVRGARGANAAAWQPELGTNSTAATATGTGAASSLIEHHLCTGTGNRQHHMHAYNHIENGAVNWGLNELWLFVHVLRNLIGSRPFTHTKTNTIIKPTHLNRLNLNH